MTDDEMIERLFETYEVALSAGNANDCGQCYAEDADYFSA